MMTTNQNAHEQALGRIIARCWADAAFKTRLLADPVAVLQAEGLPVPQGVALRAVEDTAQTVHLVIPARPAELSDEMLDGLAGGGIFDQLLRGALPPQQQPFPFPVPGFPFFLR
ncbi:MAG: NHLP leader peptide family RiPP precursor [Pseudomonadota bacterium]|nr:NHLP leader peptide family RiPP precursor [Pseudomonadota bacterium]